MSRLIDALKRLEDRPALSGGEAVSPLAVEPVVTQPVSAEQPMPEQSTQESRSPEQGTPQQSVSGQGVSEQGRGEAGEPAPSTPKQFDSPFKSRTVQESDVLPEDRAELTAPVSLRSIVAARPSPVHEGDERTESSAKQERASRLPKIVSTPSPAPTLTPTRTETDALRSELAATPPAPTPAAPQDHTPAPTPVVPQVDTPAPPETEPEIEAVAHDAKTAPEIKSDPAASLPDENPSIAPPEDDQRVSGDERLDGGLLDVCDNIFSLLPHDDRAILAFASVSEDDAHAVAIQQLAMTMAAELEDAVLVVDGSPDLAFSHAVGVRHAPRLDDLAVGRFDWQESVVQTTTPGLCVLPLSGDPATSSDGVRRLLAEIAQQYRCILIDLGGCESPLCSTLLSGCDGAVLMVESGFSPVDEAVSALRNLSEFRTQVLGVLLVKRQIAA